jgi:DNA primase
MAAEPWADTARGWLRAAASEEEQRFDDLQRVLQRLWIDQLGAEAQALATGTPDAEVLARLGDLRQRIATLKAQLVAPKPA